MRQRLREMDFIRAISALFIIVIHITALYITSSRAAFYLNQAARFSVPIFILMSGMLLYGSGGSYKGVKGYFEFIVKRLRRIFIPYLIWTFLYIAYVMRHDLSPVWLDSGVFLSATGKKILFGSGYIHLYFVTIMIQLYLLFPLLKYLMKRWSAALLFASFWITFIFQGAVYLRQVHLFTLPSFVIPYYEFFPTWLFFFVFGMSFCENLEKWKKGLDGKLLPLFGLWLASLAILIFDSKYSKVFDSSMKPSVLLYSLTTFVFFYALFRIFKDSSFILWRVFDWLSAQSFLVYLSHLMVLNFITFAAYRLGIGGWQKGTAGMLALYCATTLLTLLFAYMISKLPVAGLLGGAYTRKPKITSPPVRSPTV